ncbi:MAG: SH3 domain-containing protein [Eubacteriales bacterium]|nr:SH3 domain-containing protein [Eubacteriales bacterium]
MPVEQTLPQGAWYADVTGIDDDSTLNLRAAPDISAEVVMKLYKYQRLVVLEQCPQEGWVHVRTDAVEGYVMDKFLTRETEPTAQP